MEALRSSRTMFGGSMQGYMNTLSGLWRGAKQALANSTEVLAKGEVSFYICVFRCFRCTCISTLVCELGVCMLKFTCTRAP